MRFGGKGRSTRLGWRRVAVLGVIALGFLTMVATSQPRWTLSDTQTFKLAEGESAAQLDLTASSKNFNESRLLNVLVEAPGGVDALAWTLTIEGAEPEKKTFNMTLSPQEKGEAYKGNLEWRVNKRDNPDKLPICPEETCRLKITLERQGKELGPIEVKLVTYLEGIGDSKPPGGKAFDLNVSRQP